MEDEVPWTTEEIAIFYSGLYSGQSVEQLNARLPNRTLSQIVKLKQSCERQTVGNATSASSNHVMSDLDVLTSAAAMQDNQSEHSSSTESLDREESKVEDLTSSTSNLSLRMRVPQRPDAVNSRAGLVSPPVSKRAKFPIHVSSGPNARQSSFQSPPSRNAPHTAYQSPSTRNAPLVKHHFSQTSSSISGPSPRRMTHTPQRMVSTSSSSTSTPQFIPAYGSQGNANAFKHSQGRIDHNPRPVQRPTSSSQVYRPAESPRYYQPRHSSSENILQPTPSKAKSMRFPDTSASPSLSSRYQSAREALYRSTMVRNDSSKLDDHRFIEMELSEGFPGSKAVISRWKFLYTTLEKAKTIEFQKWCFYEYFYSCIDALYFAHNEFWESLVHLGFSEPFHIKLNELRKLKKLIGKPRRFSNNFCKMERHRLNEYRACARAVQRKEPWKQGVARMFSVEGIPQDLKKGNRVSAFSPKSNFVHEAVIVYQTPNGYNVKFFHEDLGTAILPDELIMSHEKIFSISNFDSACVSDTWALPKNTVPGLQICSSDFIKVSRILQLLDKKQLLIDHLHSLNDFMETAPSFTKLDRTSKSAIKYQYSWVLNQLEKANRELKFLLNYIQGRNIIPKGSSYDGTGVIPFFSQLREYCVEDARQVVRSCGGILPELSSNPESRDINELILSCTSLVILIKRCADQGFPPTDFLTLVEKLRPRSSSNARIFENIQDTLRYIALGLSSW